MKWLLSKHEDLSLNLRTQMKNQGMVVSVYNLAQKMCRQEEREGSLARYFSNVVIERFCVNTQSGWHLRNDTQSCSLVSIHVQTHANICMLTYTHPHVHVFAQTSTQRDHDYLLFLSIKKLYLQFI